MSDQNFLVHFIEEPIYLIKEDRVTTKEPVVDETPEAVAVPAQASASQDIQTEVVKPDTAQVETPTLVEEPSTPVYVKPLPTTGDNLKHCIVLVDSTQVLLEDPLKELLYKIMGSVKRKPEDILLANCKNVDPQQIEALLANNNHRHVLAFGTEVLAELKGVTSYAIHKVGPKSFLKADSLTEISTNLDKKKVLWKALQEMF